MALKLDTSKTYDRVEQSFQEKIMEKLGFKDRWINLMMICVKSVSYSILVNGEPKGLIYPTRGIRQGNLVSPFLFLLCSENASAIRGFSLGRRSPRLTHLLFADDSVLFYKSNQQDCQKVLEILATYESVSRQQINKRKTTLFFSKSTIDASKIEIKEALGVPEILHYDKYLRLPSFIDRHQKTSFDYIKEKVWRKLQGQKEKLLSQAGREILIKAVEQVILTYTMSCFMLPQGLVMKLRSLYVSFGGGKGETVEKFIG